MRDFTPEYFFNFCCTAPLCWSSVSLLAGMRLCTGLGSAPASVYATERPFGFHGDLGQQQNTERDVSDPILLLSTRISPLTFQRRILEAKGVPSWARIIALLNWWVNSWYFAVKRQANSTDCVTCEEKRRLSSLNETLYCSAICPLDCVAEPCGITYKLSERYKSDFTHSKF